MWRSRYSRADLALMLFCMTLIAGVVVGSEGTMLIGVSGLIGCLIGIFTQGN